MPEGIDLGVSGLASNFDWRSLLDRLSAVERAAQRRLLSEQQAIENPRTAYGSIVTQLSAPPPSPRGPSPSTAGRFPSRPPIPSRRSLTALRRRPGGM